MDTSVPYTDIFNPSTSRGENLLDSNSPNADYLDAYKIEKYSFVGLSIPYIVYYIPYKSYFNQNIDYINPDTSRAFPYIDVYIPFTDGIDSCAVNSFEKVVDWKILKVRR